MTKTSHTVSGNRTAVWVITPNGVALAARIVSARPTAEVYAAEKLGLPAPPAVSFTSLAETVAAQFRRYTGHVFIMATGIVVRTVAGLIVHKAEDPAVVVVDDRGKFAVSLLSGHLGGANALAVQVAAAIGAQPVITTATDVNAVAAIDVIAAQLGLRIENPQRIKTVNMALLTGAAIEVHDPYGLLTDRIPNAIACRADAAPGHPRVRVDDRLAGPPEALVLRPPSLVAGIGCNRNTGAEEIRSLLLDALRDAGLAPASLKSLASIDLKADEPGLSALARDLVLPVEFFDREQIRRVEAVVPTPSEAAQKHIGVKSVCEAAAILASRGGSLIVPKRTTRNATVAIARTGSIS